MSASKEQKLKCDGKACATCVHRTETSNHDNKLACLTCFLLPCAINQVDIIPDWTLCEVCKWKGRADNEM